VWLKAVVAGASTRLSAGGLAGCAGFWALFSAYGWYNNCYTLLLPSLQLKHAKLARQLDSAAAAEKAASERVEELQQELLDCSSTCRSRMRWLEQAASDAARRTQQLYRCLQNAAPLEVSGGLFVAWCCDTDCHVLTSAAKVLQ
jgi:hypothetical protein